MNQSLDKALNYLTKKENLDSVTVEELEKLVNDHPYFSIAHLLLAKKLTIENDPRSLSQVQKTALYFLNPYWLHYQLQKDVADDVLHHTPEQTKQEIGEVINQESKHKSIIIDKEQFQEQGITETNADNSKEDTFQELVIAQEDQHPLTTEFSAAELKTETVSPEYNFKINDEEIIDVAQTDDKKPGANGAPAIDVDEDELEEAYLQTPEVSLGKTDDLTEVIDKTPEQISIEPVSQPEEEMAAITRQTDATTDKFLDELEKPEPQESLVDSDAGALPVEEISATAQQERLIEEEEPEPFENENSEEIDEHEKMFQNIKAMLDASAKEANADTKNAVLPIDPYYTIDYFASQGIKLDLKKNQPDKLGKQVKKFTQWLKHMKRVGPEDALASEGISPEEVEAQRIADASNTAREVVTEAMALVLEKQGKKDKAVQLYRKLTFLNPDKSAYFAAKIKNLNGT
jgi:hypothetical protein